VASKSLTTQLTRMSRERRENIWLLSLALNENV